MSRYTYLLVVTLIAFILCAINQAHGPFYDEQVDCNRKDDECGSEPENFKTPHLEIIIPEKEDYPNELPIERDEDSVYS